MKKILMGTSAIAMAGAYAGQASAAEWDLDWGGFFVAEVGYASVDSAAGTDFDGVDVLQNAEIIFTPSITLDNGLTFGVDIQLEGNTNGDQIDESFAFVKGSFGQILIGSENSAGYKMTYGAPGVYFHGVNSGSLSAYIPGIYGNDVFRGTGGASFIEVGRNNDAQRVTYFTPRFSGFQLGVSYARDGLQDSSGPVDVDSAGTLHDIFDIGANYVNSFGGFDIAVSGRYGVGTLEGTPGTGPTAATFNPGLTQRPNGVIVQNNTPSGQANFVTSNPGSTIVTPVTVNTPAVAATAGSAGSDPEVWAVGLNLGYNGFTVGGSYASSDDSGALAQDGDFYDLGVSYKTGPWGVSFTYSHGENEVSAGGADSELDQYMGAVTYKLGPGVAVGAFAAYADFDAPGGTAGDIDGFVIGTGFKLSF